MPIGSVTETSSVVAQVRVDSGNSIANGGVVSRSPTLSLITRKFARQSHAVFSESRNAVFYRLRRSVRLGSIPIARSTPAPARTLACLRHEFSECKEGTIVPVHSTFPPHPIALTRPQFC